VGLQLEQLHVTMKSEHSSHPDIAAPHTTGNKAAGNEARVHASRVIKACRATAGTCGAK